MTSRTLSALTILTTSAALCGQTCFEAPVPTSAYRSSWHPEAIALPFTTLQSMFGMAFDSTGNTLLILTSASVFELPILRTAAGSIRGLGPNLPIVIPSPLPGAARSLTVVGNHAYAVGRPRNVNTLYELDLGSTAGWTAHPLGMPGVRVNAIAADRPGIAGAGNPDGLMLFAANTTTSVSMPWQLSAVRVGTGPLTAVTTTPIAAAAAIGFGQWQPIYLPAGEPGFSATTRSLVAPSEPSSGQNSAFEVFECFRAASTPGLPDWVPAAASPNPDFVVGGSCRGAARDPVTGDLLLLMHRTFDGNSMLAANGLYVLRRGVSTDGCSQASSGGSGAAPFPVISSNSTGLQPGGSIALSVTGAPASAPGAIHLSLVPATSQIPVGGQSLTVLSTGLYAFLGSDPTGNAHYPSIAIPGGPAMIGLRLHSQAGFLRAIGPAFTVSGVARLVVR
ncbi:MAG: hypothetical protein KDC98_15970 [Planctomycetes bacterium]|nr:hypothetical protein [Planctomycetota bacterium]